MSPGRKARVFSGEFKLRAVRRMLAGEKVKDLAIQLNVRRKLLYDWKDRYLVGGVDALSVWGRPTKSQALAVHGGPVQSERGELLQARRRIAELERKVGQQQLENDFFVEALRRVKAVQGNQGRLNERQSTGSSKNNRSKAD